MRIQGLYAAIAVNDMAAAERFYSVLFERGPDDQPMDTLIQWRDVAGANVQIFLKSEIAGSSVCTIVVPEMAAARASLEAAGLSLTRVQEGDFGKIAHLADPSGNDLILAEPPRGMGG